MENKTIAKVLIAIILLGAFLRFHDIGKESFWSDEIGTVLVTQQAPSEIVHDIYTTTRHAPHYLKTGGTPPFYYVLANYWTKLVGLSEARLRLLSALLGIMAIYVIFLAGRLIFNDKVGLISAFMLSINYIHIDYSQEARTYSIGIFLALLSVYFLMSALKKKKPLYWAGHVISSTLLVYTHYFGVFVLIFEYLFMLVFIKKYIKYANSILLSCLGIFILYLPWFPALFRQILDKNYLESFLGSRNILYDIAIIYTQFNSWFTPDLETRISIRAVYHSLSEFKDINIYGVSLIGIFTMVSVMLITVLLGTVFLSSVFIKDKKFTFSRLKEEKYIFLLMWFLAPIVIPIILTLIFPKSPVFGFVQYTLFGLPAYIIILSNGLMKIKKYLAVLVILAMLSILPLNSLYSNAGKQEWREVGKYLNDNREGSEFIAVNKDNHVFPLNYYYKRMQNVEGVKNPEEFMSKIGKPRKFILVYSSESFGDPKGELKNYLDANYRITKKVEFTGIKVFHYSR